MHARVCNYVQYNYILQLFSETWKMLWQNTAHQSFLFEVLGLDRLSDRIKRSEKDFYQNSKSFYGKIHKENTRNSHLPFHCKFPGTMLSIQNSYLSVPEAIGRDIKMLGTPTHADRL